MNNQNPVLTPFTPQQAKAEIQALRGELIGLGLKKQQLNSEGEEFGQNDRQKYTSLLQRAAAVKAKYSGLRATNPDIEDLIGHLDFELNHFGQMIESYAVDVAPAAGGARKKSRKTKKSKKARKSKAKKSKKTKKSN